MVNLTQAQVEQAFSDVRMSDGARIIFGALLDAAFKNNPIQATVQKIKSLINANAFIAAVKEAREAAKSSAEFRAYVLKHADDGGGRDGMGLWECKTFCDKLRDGKIS